MAKAVLVMDIPERCNDCYSAYMSTTGTFICRVAREKIPPKPRTRPDWCPLRELPEKMKVCGKYPQPDGITPSYKVGWNACLDKILEGCDEK
mgnify:CR=1 FL=1